MEDKTVASISTDIEKIYKLTMEDAQVVINNLFCAPFCAAK